MRGFFCGQAPSFSLKNVEVGIARARLPKRGGYPLSPSTKLLRVTLVLPEPIEAIRCELGVLDRVLDVPVTQVVLNGAGVVTIVG